MSTSTIRKARLIPTRAPETLAWIRLDLLTRLVPFAFVVTLVYRLWRPAWLGFSPGNLGAQLWFGLLGGALLFLASGIVQLLLTRRRQTLRVPADRPDLLLQTGFYWLNGPVEEALFRGLLQGGLTVLAGPWLGLPVATAVYVLYHRLGRWAWLDVSATALLGVPLALAFWQLPGPPSLLGVGIAHACATCGFLGPGPWLLHRLRLV
jgi:membrane protease YdiL (CAAX protease family)